MALPGRLEVSREAMGSRQQMASAASLLGTLVQVGMTHQVSPSKVIAAVPTAAAAAAAAGAGQGKISAGHPEGIANHR